MLIFVPGNLELVVVVDEHSRRAGREISRIDGAPRGVLMRDG